MTIDKSKACCFTGHRIVGKDDFSYDRLIGYIKGLYKIKGVDTFICGGAIGFDTVAGEAVLEVKKEIPELRLVLFLPCKNQDARWNSADKKRYGNILKSADYVDCPDTEYKDGVMKARNYKMVDNSSYCICYFNGKFASGTGQTVRYAQKSGKPVYNCYNCYTASRE